MPGIHSSVHVTSVLGLIGFIVLWLALVECAKVLIVLLKNDPLIGWAIGPLGVTPLVLCEPTTFFILFNALFPAIYRAVFFSSASSVLCPARSPCHIARLLRFW